MKKKTELIVTVVSYRRINHLVIFLVYLMQMQNTITPVTFRRLQFSQFFRVTPSQQIQPSKAMIVKKRDSTLDFPSSRNLPRNAQKTHPRRHRGCCCFRYIHPPPICTVSCNRTCLLRTSYSIFNRALKLINLLKNLKSAKFQFEACTTMLEYVCKYDYYTKK